MAESITDRYSNSIPDFTPQRTDSQSVATANPGRVSGPQPRAQHQDRQHPQWLCPRPWVRTSARWHVASASSRSGCSPAIIAVNSVRGVRRRLNPGNRQNVETSEHTEQRGDVDRPVTVGEHLVDSSRVGVVCHRVNVNTDCVPDTRVRLLWDNVVATLLHPVVLFVDSSGVSRMLGSHWRPLTGCGRTEHDRDSSEIRFAKAFISRQEYVRVSGFSLPLPAVRIAIAIAMHISEPTSRRNPRTGRHQRCRPLES